MNDKKSELPTGDLIQAQAPIQSAKSMPAGFYTSPEIYQREHSEIFLKNWFFVGRTDELPSPGDFQALETVGGPALLIRGEDGVLRAFANICRHRGSILLEGEGNCRRVVCPYHAWSYFIDGQLYGCPDMEDAENFDRVENGLLPIRMEVWAGFIFLTYNNDAPPLIEHLGDMPARMASHKFEDMRSTWKIELECACNWKLLLENAMETYHTGTVHRESVGAQTSRTIETRGEWLCIQVISDQSIATLPGAIPSFAPIEDLDADAQKGTYFTVIHPTCQFAVAQDCMWWLNVLPRSESSTLLEIGGCFPVSVRDDPDFATKAKPYYQRWKQVGREDISILERQQKALSSVLYRPGPLSHRDDQVQALGLWVLRQLNGNSNL